MVLLSLLASPFPVLGNGVLGLLLMLTHGGILISLVLLLLVFGGFLSLLLLILETLQFIFNHVVEHLVRFVHIWIEAVFRELPPPLIVTASIRNDFLDETQVELGMLGLHVVET